VYGVTHPLANYDPLWANFAPFANIAERMREGPPGRALGVLFAHPGRGATLPVDIDRRTWSKHDPRPSPRVAGYVFAHFVLLALSAGAFLDLAERLPAASIVAPSAIVLGSAVALGAWSEGRRWALPLDLARQAAAVVLAFGIVAGLRGFAAAGAAALGLVLLFAALFFAFRPAAAVTSHAGT